MADEGSRPTRWILERRSELTNIICIPSREKLIVLATILSPGDLLLTEELTYPGLKAVAALLHLRTQGLPMDAEGPLPDAFADACRTGTPRALYLVPTIHNPTGTVMPEARRREIAEIARRFDVALVEDDIHALLPEERPRPPLMAALASTWIEDGTADALLAARRRAAAARQALARERLSGLRCDAHPASYFAWLHLPEPWRSDTFTAEARAHGVAVTPAEVFLVGRAAVPPAVRVCLGAARTDLELDRGLRSLTAVLAGSGEGAGAVV